MEAHCFNEDIRVKRFCLTLLGEARLWYQSLEPLGETTWAYVYVLNQQPSRKIFHIHFMTFSAILYIIIHYNYTYFTYEYLLDVGKYLLPSTL